jgi:hypothetical protein
VSIIPRSTLILTDNQLVKEYFRQIQNSAEATLSLFKDDAIIYEPFSLENGLRGKEEIGYFLKVARMANVGLQRKISILSRSKNRIEVLVRFTRGSTVQSRCEFRTEDIRTKIGMEKKIKELRIQFLG